MSDVDPHAARAPRVLVDLAALERVDLWSPPRTRSPTVRRAATPPRFAHAQGQPPAVAMRAIADRAALVTIGRLGREGRIVLCTYPEFDAPGVAAHWRGTWRSLLGEVPVTAVAPAVDRSELGADVFAGAAQAGALARLCTILKQDSAQGGPLQSAGSAAAADGGDGARPGARFRQLAARVQGHHLADVFHLWSGECADCAYWLTLDETLDAFVHERVMPGLVQELRCVPVLPGRLLERMGVQERDEVPGEGPRVVPLRAPRSPAS